MAADRGSRERKDAKAEVVDDEGHTYEQARDELAEVVAKLEAGGLTLDESLDLWERGEYLARACHRFLDGARERVDAALAEAADEAEPAGSDS